MFLGYYAAEIKQDNRLPLPAGFRELISDGLYIAQGFDRNVMALTINAFEHMYQQMMALNIADPLARLFLRMFLGTASYVKVGKDGALPLTEELTLFADLKDAVVIVGQGDFFELWSMDQWKQQKEQLKDFQANAQRFSAFKIATR